MPTASPVPAGFHTVTPYLSCKDPRAQIEFLKRAFGAEERLVMTAPGADCVMHAELRIQDSPVFLTTANPECMSRSAQELGGSPISLWLYVVDMDGLFARATKAGAEVVMPPTDMFWGDRMAVVKDPEGLSWTVASRKRELTPAELAEAAKAAFAEMGNCQA